MRKKSSNHPALILHHYVQLRADHQSYDGRTVRAGAIGRIGAVDVPAVRLTRVSCGKRHETFACVDFWTDVPLPPPFNPALPNSWVTRVSVYPCDVIAVCVLCATKTHRDGVTTCGDFLPNGKDRIELYDVAPWLLDRSTRELMDAAREDVQRAQ